jgi:hypothetical protein
LKIIKAYIVNLLSSLISDIFFSIGFALVSFLGLKLINIHFSFIFLWIVFTLLFFILDGVRSVLLNKLMDNQNKWSSLNNSSVNIIHEDVLDIKRDINKIKNTADNIKDKVRSK